MHFFLIVTTTGKDATNDFEDVGHSVDAHNLMKDFEIGEVDITSMPEVETYKPATSPQYNHDKSSAFIIKILQFLGPIVILALALTLRYLYKKNSSVEWMRKKLSSLQVFQEPPTSHSITFSKSIFLLIATFLL